LRPATPLILLILAATAIPVELQAPGDLRLNWEFVPTDLIANVIGYLPLGLVLSRRSIGYALAVSVLLTTAAETSQLFMLHRFPSLIDVTLNLAGAAIGWKLARMLKVPDPMVRLDTRTCRIALLMGAFILGAMVISDWDDALNEQRSANLAVNARGATVPGSLEARWRFDDPETVRDSSGNGADGTLLNGAFMTAGIRGNAVALNGEDAHVDFRSPANLRLMGNMTLVAWIKPSSFPVDDAAIISSTYQLDTTIDKGPRTLGFKLIDTCGESMARYGKTELARDTWYHAAGVYDADATTMHVYLNGQVDDGPMRGEVTAMQQASSERVYVGRRPDLDGFSFTGVIDDARVYSMALTQEEIVTIMAGGEPTTGAPGTDPGWRPAREIASARLSTGAARCHEKTLPTDANIPLVLVSLGMLSAIAFAGFWTVRRVVLTGVGAVLGMLLMAAAALTPLPAYVLYLFPVLTSLGAAAIAFSLFQARPDP
jgi:hypothetical protein